jgi:hypothetical protein
VQQVVDILFVKELISEPQHTNNKNNYLAVVLEKYSDWTPGRSDQRQKPTLRLWYLQHGIPCRTHSEEEFAKGACRWF